MKLDPKDKVGQLDFYKKPKSSFGDTIGGIAVAVIVIVVLVNVFG